MSEADPLFSPSTRRTLPRPGAGPARSRVDRCADETLDRLGIQDSVDVVGHSMGGLAALAYAIERPERTRALCWAPACPAFRPPPSACPKVGGHAIYTYVMLTAGHEPTDALAEELRIHVGHEMGPIARPEKIEFVTKLPKTRSGKIMRRVLKARALRIAEGDLTMLEE